MGRLVEAIAVPIGLKREGALQTNPSTNPIPITRLEVMFTLTHAKDPACHHTTSLYANRLQHYHHAREILQQHLLGMQVMEHVTHTRFRIRTMPTVMKTCTMVY